MLVDKSHRSEIIDFPVSRVRNRLTPDALVDESSGNFGRHAITDMRPKSTGTLQASTKSMYSCEQLHQASLSPLPQVVSGADEPVATPQCVRPHGFVNTAASEES